MEPDKPNNTKKIVAVLAVLIVVVVIVAATKLAKKDTGDTTKTSNTPASSQTANDTKGASTTTSTQAFKDGTYQADGQYDSPGGLEKVHVSVTLKDNIVEDSSVTTQSSGSEARQFQDEFISNYKKQVTGKNITSIHLSTVSGSSLTSGGFNEALDNIKNQAKAS